METLTIKIDKNTMSYVSKKHRNINTYLSRLIKEDMLLNQIKESKKSWINKLETLDDLDF